MNEHQRRLWESRIELIDRYLNDQNQNFYVIVGNLEGALDASEIRDNHRISEWYDFCVSLELWPIEEGKKFNRDKAIEKLKAMKSFLVRHL